MGSHVTAILVARDRGTKLQETLDALAAQVIAPERIILVAQGSEEFAGKLASDTGLHVIRVNEKFGFGQAVQAGLHGTAPLSDGQPEWLWLLADDSAPEPVALQQLILRVKTTGTAAVAGPKLVDWDDPSRIIELSQGLTWSGARWVLDRQELDQQQYDHYEDVLGVGPVGMLVRRDVWDRLGGFDPALPIYDDGLDFSVRARLAGYRVVVAPAARLRFARGGTAGPEINHRGRVLRRAHRLARTAQLHRRLVYTPALLAPLMWLALPIIGVLGMGWALIRERPGTMLGELLAALTVFFHPGRILRSRRTLRRHSSAGWGAVRPLRTDRKTVTSVRAVRRESILAAEGRTREELHFVHTGGLALTIIAALAGIGMSWWLLGASFLTGGGAGQLSPTLPELWGSTISAAAVNVQSLGSFTNTVPADPFTWVLALLGTITFWNTSFAIVLLIITTIPLAALGGWMWASRLTSTTAGRVLGGVVWAAAPVTLIALHTGRIPTLVLIATLPWLCYAASQASRSWSWAGVTSFLAAIVLASSPTLIPTAILLLIVGVATHPRGVAKLLTTVIVPLTLFAPMVLHALARGSIGNMFADPGVPLASGRVPLTEQLLGFSEPGLQGLSPLAEQLGITLPGSVWLVALALLAPLALLALVGLFTGTPRQSLLLGLMAISGLATAHLAPFFSFVVQGNTLIPLTAAPGTAVFTLAILSLAVIGTRELRRAQIPATVLAIVGVLLLAVPGLVRFSTADVNVTPDRSPIPAVMSAELRSDPRAQTLVLTPVSEDELRAELVGRDSLALDRLRTARLTSPEHRHEGELAELVASLASVGSSGLTEPLAADNIKFLLLPDSPGSGGTQLRALLQEAFDQNEALSPVGATEYGLMWRVVPPAPEDSGADAVTGETPSESATDAEESTGAAGTGNEPNASEALSTEDLDIPTTKSRPVSGKMLWAAQLLLLGLMFLLALPTGEVQERPVKRKKRRRLPATVDTVPTVTGAVQVVPPTAPAADEESQAQQELHDLPVDEESRAAEVLQGSDEHEPREAVSDHTDEISIIPDHSPATHRPTQPQGEDDEWELPDDDTIFVGNSPTEGPHGGTLGPVISTSHPETETPDPDEEDPR